jgi:hypothetical protein
MQARLKETIDHLRSDIDKVSEPQTARDVRNSRRGANRTQEGVQ